MRHECGLWHNCGGTNQTCIAGEKAVNKFIVSGCLFEGVLGGLITRDPASVQR